jgi:RNA polymerase sigma factor (sigma-70 family)
MKKKRTATYAITTGNGRPGSRPPSYKLLRPNVAMRRLSSLPAPPCPLPINSQYTPDQEDILIARARLGDRAAGDMLLLAFDKTIRRCAKKWFYAVNGHDLDLDDLTQVARMGLMHAIHKFDRKKGGFEAYLTEWLRQHCVRSIQNYGYAVRLPVHKHQAISNHERHQPNDPLPHKLHEAMLAKRPTRLDAPLKGAEYTTRADLLQSPCRNIEDAYISDQHCRIVKEAVAELRGEMTPLDRAILDQRILSDDPKTMATIGRENSRSRERARQREGVIMCQLRHAIRQRLSRIDVL